MRPVADIHQQRAVTIDERDWPALQAWCLQRGMRLARVPGSPGQMPRYRTTTVGVPIVRAATTLAGATLQMRELQVLHGMAEGKDNDDIAAELFLSTQTVKTHAQRLYRKLEARNRAHAVSIAYQRGILRTPDSGDRAS